MTKGYKIIESGKEKYYENIDNMPQNYQHIFNQLDNNTKRLFDNLQEGVIVVETNTNNKEMPILENIKIDNLYIDEFKKIALQEGYFVEEGDSPNIESYKDNFNISVDNVVFALEEYRLKVLLVQRKGETYHNFWAIPGGFVEKEETLKQSAYRELREETSIKDIELYNFSVFSDPYRDPRGRNISISYLAITNNIERIKSGSDAKDIGLFDINELPKLAFDHDKIINTAYKKLKEFLYNTNLAKNILGDKFKKEDIKKAYDIIFNSNIKEDYIIKRLEINGIIEDVGENYYKFIY